MISLREHLKTGTADLHDSIEKGARMSRLLDPELTRAEYVAFLRSMLTAYEHIENRLMEIPRLQEVVSDLSRRNKVASLKQDLAAMDEADTAAAGAAHLPIQNLSEAMGVLYVIEGSSLGGQIIAKRLAQLDFVDEKNLNFFHHYGSELGKYWQRFVQQMEFSYQRNLIQRDAVLTGARNTFKYLMAV